MTSADPRLAALRTRLGARAVGWWAVVGHGLVQVAFSAAAEMPDEVSSGFAEATRRVPLSESGLGIVRAAVTGETAVSRAADLPADSGSGLWLRRFSADRSVAVPILGGSGEVRAVVSVALAGDRPSDIEAEAEVRSAARDWTGAGEPESGRMPSAP